MDIIPERVTAEMEGEFVVFMIGMRINQPLNIRAWWPVTQAMPRMIRELQQHPELGLLAVQSSGLNMVQYWRSVEHLNTYAASHQHAHLPAWRAYNQSLRRAGTAVGIWHETYVIKPGQYENVYVNMPRYGLGRVATLSPATGHRQGARGRMTRQAAASAD